MFVGIPCLHLAGDAYTDYSSHYGSGNKRSTFTSHYPTLEITLNSSMQLVIDKRYIGIEASIILFKELLGLPVKQTCNHFFDCTSFSKTLDGKTVLYINHCSYTLTPTAKRILTKMLEVATGFCKEEVEREYEEEEILQETVFKESRKDKKVTEYWVARIKDTKHKVFETMSLQYNECEDKMKALNPEYINFDLVEYIKVEVYE